MIKVGIDHYYHKPHWHSDKQQAVDRAELMRKAKIAALRKQIEKLERMTFE